MLFCPWYVIKSRSVSVLDQASYYMFQRTPLPFKQANVPAMRTKLFALSDSFAQEAVSSFYPGVPNFSLTKPPRQATSEVALTSDETAALNRIFIAINEASSDPASTTSINITENDVSAVLEIVARWPTASRFPGQPVRKKLLVIF